MSRGSATSSTLVSLSYVALAPKYRVHLVGNEGEVSDMMSAQNLLVTLNSRERLNVARSSRVMM